MTTTAVKPQRLWAAPLPLTAAALSLGLAGLIAAGLLTGLQNPGQLSDPGALTRWGLPVARFIHHLAMSVAVAAAIFAALVIPASAGPRQRQRKHATAEHPLYARTLLIAQCAGVVWTLAALAVLVLSFSSLSGLPVSVSETFSGGLWDFVLSIATGQAWLIVAIIAGLFATIVTAVRSPLAMGLSAVLGLVAIVPMALVGHSSSGDDHIAAVNSLGLHLLGVIIWVGGLVCLALLAPTLAQTSTALRAGEQGGAEILGTVLRRFSVLASLAIALVAASGVINAALRVFHIEELITTDYGRMLLVKLVCTVALAIIGFLHRNWIIPQLAGPLVGTAATGTAPTSRSSRSPRSVSKLLWQLVLVEVAIMAAVMGVSTVLGRTAPPVPEELPDDASAARMLTGYPLPPEPGVTEYFTQWRPDWLWVAVIVFLAAWYIQATVKVRRRGIRWPIMRAVSWLFGLAVLFWITSGGPAVYGMVLFSGHMMQHMTLTMVAPIFLVMGSPVTLAMRALPVRADGTRGAREWILWLVHSPWSRFVTHPIVAAANFAGSLLLFYYTPIFGWALEYHLGHIFMTVHFLLTGYIFALVIIGRDPLPRRPPHFLRLIMLLATMVFHAFLAISITGAEQLFVADWFGNIGHGWFPAMEDQIRGGELMWGLGEIPAVMMGVIAAIQWSKDDTRESKRKDREADRTGEAELEEYNEMLAAMAERGHR